MTQQRWNKPSALERGLLNGYCIVECVAARCFVIGSGGSGVATTRPVRLNYGASFVVLQIGEELFSKSIEAKIIATLGSTTLTRSLQRGVINVKGLKTSSWLVVRGAAMRRLGMTIVSQSRVSISASMIRTIMELQRDAKPIAKEPPVLKRFESPEDVFSPLGASASALKEMSVNVYDLESAHGKMLKMMIQTAADLRHCHKSGCERPCARPLANIGRHHNIVSQTRDPCVAQFGSGRSELGAYETGFAARDHGGACMCKHGVDGRRAMLS